MSSDKKPSDKAQSKREIYSQARSTTESSLPRSPDAKQMKKTNSSVFAWLNPFGKKSKDKTPEPAPSNETPLPAQPSAEPSSLPPTPDRKQLRRTQSSAPSSEGEEPKKPRNKKTAKKTEATPSTSPSDSEEPKKVRKKKKAQTEEATPNTTPSETTATLQPKRSIGHLPKPSGDVPPLKLPRGIITDEDTLPPPSSVEPSPERTASPVLGVLVPTAKGRLRSPTNAELFTSQTTTPPVVNNANTASLPNPPVTLAPVARVKRHCPKPSGGNGDTPTLSKLRPPSMVVVGPFTQTEAEKTAQAQETQPGSPGQSPSGSPR